MANTPYDYKQAKQARQALEEAKIGDQQLKRKTQDRLR